MINTNGHQEIVSELIGRQAPPLPTLSLYSMLTRDASRPTYDFWSKFARGKEEGYRLGALFARRIVEIDSEWTLGRGFSVKTGNEATDELFEDFVTDNLDIILDWRKDASKLGDSYIVVNVIDGSLTLKSPDTGEIIEDDMGRTIGYRFTDRFPTLTVVDEYFAFSRVLTLKRHSASNVGTLLNPMQNLLTLQDRSDSITFPNLIAPLIPVVHLSNDKETNEVYGRPIYEGLLTLFGRYDDVLNKGLDGVEALSRPVPTITSTDPDGDRERNQTREEDAWNAETKRYEKVGVVDFENVTMFWLKDGGTFQMVQANDFFASVSSALKKLFYLMLEHVGIPEWVWGGSVAGGIGGNSTQSQTPAFTRYLEGRRVTTQKALLMLCRILLAVQRLTTFFEEVLRLWIEWPEIEGQDEAMRFKWVEWADKTGKLDDVTALTLADLVENPAEVVEKAHAEAVDEDEQAFDMEVQRQEAFSQLGNNPNQENNQ